MAFLSISVVFTTVGEAQQRLARITASSVSEAAIVVTVSVRNGPI